MPLTKATRRQRTRLRLPIRVLVNGHAYYPLDISLSGCAIKMSGGGASGLLPITLLFPPHNGETEQFQLWAETVRHASDGRLVLRFLDVEEDFLLALRDLLDRLA